MGIAKSKNIEITNIYNSELCKFETKYIKLSFNDMYYIKMTIFDIDIYYWINPFDGESNNNMLNLAIERYFKVNKKSTKIDLLMLINRTVHNLTIYHFSDEFYLEKIIYLRILAQLIIQVQLFTPVLI